MIGQRPQVVVSLETTNPQRGQEAQALAERLDLPWIDGAQANAAFTLAVRDDLLELRDASMRPGRGVSVDFAEFAPAKARSRGMLSRRQPIAKAIGSAARTVLDATAGLGQDSALLAALGHSVIAVERSPIIAELLKDGLRRAQDDRAFKSSIIDRIQIVMGDARDVLRQHRFSIDAVYIDPMFPPKRKASALANKRVRLLREIVGADEDAAELVAIARQQAPRVIVKRPTYAAPLAENPTASFGGNLVRYDVYVQKRTLE